MKNNGLRNRFSEETRNQWIFWYGCMICGENRIDALHHIISPSSHLYVDGKHNESVLNSCPIHNMKCHIGNESHLYKDETISHLLGKTYVAQFTHLGNLLSDLDNEFLKVYGHLYEEGILF